MKNFVILDDEVHDLKKMFPKNFVKIDPDNGITPTDVSKAKKIIKSLSEEFADLRRLIREGLQSLSSNIL